MERPLVSVVTPFLNPGRFLGEAVASVTEQTYEHWELLLVDDGASDRSSKLAQDLVSCDPVRMKYFAHPGRQHRGASASRNLGLRHARGEYVAFLDADDGWFPTTLERQVSTLEAHPEAAMVYAKTQYWYSWTGKPEDLEQDLVPDLGVPLDTLLRPPTLLTTLYPLGTTTAPSLNTVMIRRPVIQRLGGFEDAFSLAYTDQAFLVKAYLHESIFVSRVCCDRYRQHPNSSSAIVANTGQYDAIRSYFLHWLERYLRCAGVRQSEVWRALKTALAGCPSAAPLRCKSAVADWAYSN